MTTVRSVSITVITLVINKHVGLGSNTSLLGEKIVIP